MWRVCATDEAMVPSTAALWASLSICEVRQGPHSPLPGSGRIGLIKGIIWCMYTKDQKSHMQRTDPHTTSKPKDLASSLVHRGVALTKNIN
mmetsp:Transcript_87944/g.145492  ORF Transcript_87944/g.145492 Transcript_87944/m.145492 type:complete len:91 (-) Transcript_87944:186-458(-)